MHFSKRVASCLALVCFITAWLPIYEVQAHVANFNSFAQQASPHHQDFSNTSLHAHNWQAHSHYVDSSPALGSGHNISRMPAGEHASHHWFPHHHLNVAVNDSTQSARSDNSISSGSNNAVGLSASSGNTTDNTSIVTSTGSATQDRASSNANGGGSPTGVNQHSINLDLSSVISSTTAGHFLGTNTVTITVGGTPLTVSATTPLTPAERVAVHQVMSSGVQSIVLNSQGAADGGSLTIGPRLNSMLSGLDIPQGVTVTDTSRTGTVTIGGSLTDSGTLYLTSHNPSVSSIFLAANSINILNGGAVSDILPVSTPATTSPIAVSSQTGTVPIHNHHFVDGNSSFHWPIQSSTNNLTSVGAMSTNGSTKSSDANTRQAPAPTATVALATNTKLDLGLASQTDITNSGTISSGGSLTLTAGGSIVNSLPSGAAGSTPAIQAQKDINLISGSGDVTNGGIIITNKGNINVASTVPSRDININASGGAFQANNGAINIRDTSYNGSGNTNLNGGNYLSRELNLNSGSGTVNANVGQVTGALTTGAQIAHINTNTPVLVLGNQTLSGDPTYANTGTIDISGLLTITGGDLAIIAGGNIQATSASAAIVDHGGNVLMIAGANIASGGGTGGASFSGTNPAGNTVSDVTVSLAGGSGGSINLSLSDAATVIDTSNGSGAGGNVTLVALASGGTGGRVITSGGVGLGAIDTAGSGANTGGNVTIYAGAPNTAAAIDVNSITTHGGSVWQQTTQAVTSDGNVLTINTSGDISSNNSIIAGQTVATSSAFGYGNIDTSNAAGAGGNVVIAAGADVSATGYILFAGINTSVTSGSAAAGSVTITALGSISVLGSTDTHNDGTGAGGNVAFTSTNSYVTTAAITTLVSSGSGVGNAGNVTITAGGSSPNGYITVGGTIDAHNHGAGTGGTVTLTSSNDLVTTQAIFTCIDNGSGVGNAGNLTISAYGPITVNGTVQALNFGTGAGGSVSLTSSHDLVSIQEIDTYQNTVSAAGGSGNVTISASGNISVTGIIDAQNKGAGATGIVTLTSTAGSVSATNNISTDGFGSTSAGNVIISAYGSINASSSNILAPSGSGSPGNITLTSSTGSISFLEIDAYGSGAARSGDVTISANGSINVPDGVFVYNFGGTGGGGNVSATSTNGGVTIGEIDTYVSNSSGVSKAGNVTISAGGASPNGFINAGGSIDAHNDGTGAGGTVTLTSSNDSVMAQNIYTYNDNASGLGNAGNVTISGHNGILVAGIIQAFNDGAGRGGSVTLTSSNSGIGTQEIDTFSQLGLTAAGNVTISASAAINITGTIFANNYAGSAAGGTVTLTSSNASVTTRSIDTDTVASGTAGNLTISAVGPIAVNGELDASCFGTGAGGIVTIKDADAADTLFVGMAIGTNYIQGSIQANGGHAAGTINLETAGNVYINAGGSVTADSGASGTGGKIQFTYVTPTQGPVNVEDDGAISATNTGTDTSGRVGFNGGNTYTVNLIGSGTLFAGEYVGMGGLNPNTLAIDGSVVPAPITNNFSIDNVTVLFPNGGSFILNEVIVGTIPPTPSPTPIPISPSHSSLPVPALPASLSLPSNGGLTPQQLLFAYLNFLFLQQQTNNSLNEQIGTRIATDYTPYTLLPDRPKFPLQGGISIAVAPVPGEAIFSASDFTKDELLRMATQGIVFGPGSGGNFFDLAKGNVLFMPKNDIRVQTKEGIAYIPKGSAAWVMETGNDSAIYDLHDTVHGGIIKVNVNDKEFTLLPGREILLTKNSTDDFQLLNPGGSVGYRNVKSTDLGAGIRAYICEFSIPNALSNFSNLHKLLVSDNLEYKKATYRILKNAAILTDLTGSDYKGIP